MKRYRLRTLAGMAICSMALILAANAPANSQNRSKSEQKQERASKKQEAKMEKQRVKAEQQRVTLERQRETSWMSRNNRIGSTRTGGRSNYGADPAANRYRVMRNGSYYNTDRRGAEILRQSVNDGYRAGFNAARTDRNNNRNVSWTNSPVYQNGTAGYQSHVNRGQYQYYFRQGFQRGYQDGSNKEYLNGHSGPYQYGSYEHESLNIHDSILDFVLNLQSY